MSDLNWNPELPRILKQPLQLEDGTVLWEGDKVEHVEFGEGTILRVWTYESIGTCLYIDFGNDIKKEIHLNFVKKGQSMSWADWFRPDLVPNHLSSKQKQIVIINLRDLP